MGPISNLLPFMPSASWQFAQSVQHQKDTFYTARSFWHDVLLPSHATAYTARASILCYQKRRGNLKTSWDLNLWDPFWHGNAEPSTQNSSSYAFKTEVEKLETFKKSTFMLSSRVEFKYFFLKFLHLFIDIMHAVNPFSGAKCQQRVFVYDQLKIICNYQNKSYKQSKCDHPTSLHYSHVVPLVGKTILSRVLFGNFLSGKWNMCFKRIRYQC